MLWQNGTQVLIQTYWLHLPYRVPYPRLNVFVCLCISISHYIYKCMAVQVPEVENSSVMYQKGYQQFYTSACTVCLQTGHANLSKFFTATSGQSIFFFMVSYLGYFFIYAHCSMSSNVIYSFPIFFLLLLFAVCLQTSSWISSTMLVTSGGRFLQSTAAVSCL